MAVEREHLLRRLMFIRHIYESGCRQAKQPYPYSTASVLQFHDAVELFIQLGLEHHDAEEKRDFLQCYDALKGKVDELSNRQAIKQLNEARVAVKHKGIEISEKEVAQAQSRATAFLEDNCHLLFGVDFVSFSLLSHIKHDEARRRLEAAAALIEDGKLNEAMAEVAVAFAVFRRDSAIFRSDIGSRFQRNGPLEGIATFVWKVNLNIVLLSLGVDPKRFRIFEHITPTVFLAHSGKPSVQWVRSMGSNEQQVKFAFDFVVECITRIEAWTPEI